MSKIKIQNFGAINKGNLDNDGWIDIKKVTVFIGNQGSGKSTVAKLISTFMWIEKALFKGDYDKKWFEEKGKFRDVYLSYHRLENYFKNNDIKLRAIIEYEGDAFYMKYDNESLIIQELNKQYVLPQIMYVPAERNFITFIKTPKDLTLSSEPLKEFLTEFENAKNELKDYLHLPINNTHLQYNKLNNKLNLIGNDFNVTLTEASSGFQSSVPLYLVSNYLANTVKKQSEITKESMSIDELKRFKKGVEQIWSTVNLTDEQRRVALSVLSSKFNKSAFINIVEEPEQNLFPSSQWNLLQSLLGFNNINDENKLIITTHSPYIINFLNIVIQSKYLENKILHNDKNELLVELYKVVDKNALIYNENVVIYELDETNGTIHKLPTKYGILSDKNYLNEKLREGNQLFDKLLEIEEKL
jgi:predicted ATPase